MWSSVSRSEDKKVLQQLRSNLKSCLAGQQFRQKGASADVVDTVVIYCWFYLNITEMCENCPCR